MSLAGRQESRKHTVEDLRSILPKNDHTGSRRIYAWVTKHQELF